MDVDSEPDGIEPILLATFREYVEKREKFYRDTRRILNALLSKDVLLLALRGIRTSDEFVDHAFAAFESSSEETMWGNSWQEAIAKSAPNTVGGGDLRTERDGTLWVIQLKMGTQNAGAVAQDLRVLKAKVAQELDHHPGRKDVKAMYAIIRGEAQSRWRHHRDHSPANQDIVGFQYQFMVGADFRNWMGANFAARDLVAALEPMSSRVSIAREESLAAIKEALRARLNREGLEADISGVLRLTEIPTRRNRPTKDQSSS